MYFILVQHEVSANKKPVPKFMPQTLSCRIQSLVQDFAERLWFHSSEFLNIVRKAGHLPKPRGLRKRDHIRAIPRVAPEITVSMIHLRDIDWTSW
jgi:hypothetical protein